MEMLTVKEGLSQGFINTIIQDRRGFIWIGTKDGLNRYDGYQLRVFTMNPFEPWALRAPEISGLLEDTARRLIWIGTDNGLWLFDPVSERFYEMRESGINLPQKRVHALSSDDGGNFMVSFSSGELYHLQVADNYAEKIRKQGKADSGDFQLRLIEPAPPTVNYPPLVDCLSDGSFLFVTTEGDIYTYQPQTLQRARFSEKRQQRYTFDSDGIIWAKKHNYVYRLQKEDGSDSIPPVNHWGLAFKLADQRLAIWPMLSNGPLFIKKDHAPFNTRSGIPNKFHADTPEITAQFTRINVPGNTTDALLMDKTGLFWVGTGGVGLVKVNLEQLAFRSYFLERSVSSLRRIDASRIWVRFFDRFSAVLNIYSGNVEPAPWAAAIDAKQLVSEVAADRNGNFWLMIHRDNQRRENRLAIWKTAEQTLQYMQDTLPYLPDIPENILEDKQGNMWVSGHSGLLLRYRPGISTAERFFYGNLTPSDGRELRSNSIAQDAQGVLWIGTNKGLIEIPAGANSVLQFKIHTYDPQKPATISSDWITHILPDPRQPHIIWLGTRGGGLNRFDKTTRQFSFITKGPERLPDNVVYGILPDASGSLWCSTNHGICRYNPLDNTFTVYRESDGLLNTEYNTAAFLSGQDGYLWFGGVSGLNAFRPAEIQVADVAPSVYITDIVVQGLRMFPDEYNRLKLKSDQNNLTVHFAVSDFRNPGGNRYHYRLNGGEWIPLGTAHSATFSALPPGNYLLEVEGATADSPWSADNARLYLQIDPPWYRTPLAWLLYAVLLVAAITVFIRYRLRLFKIEHSAELDRLESMRLKSFDEIKNRFFADAAHEVRTPLTIIRGLSERLLRNEKPGDTRENAQLILRQSENLLELSNQLLDLARLDSRQLKLMLFHGDFQEFVGQQVAGFVPLAADKGVQLHFECRENHLWMDFDPMQIKKILNNLLSNAIRHTDNGGNITVTLERLPSTNSLELHVLDTGEGISAAALPHVFERYHQGENPRRKGAAGIGLALSAELVKLMGGQISVSSTLNQGTNFKILLPIVQADSAPINEEFTLPEQAPGLAQQEIAVAKTDKSYHLPLLLLIEDNEQILSYLQNFLSPYYRVKTAKDGISGIKIALQFIPDLIVTDINMPGKNGYEVTETLKSDERSSHIPIVMLSARTEAEDRLEGHRRKANAYLSKPFSEQELLLILQNLLELRDQLREKYAGRLQNGDLLRHTPTDQEDAFLQKIHTIFEQNYQDDSFKLPQLCRALAISSSQLDRKLNALTEQSPMEMLRRFRLAKAHELLKSRQPKPSVQEVCYACGFKSPEHFSRLFSDTYGISPSEV